MGVLTTIILNSADFQQQTRKGNSNLITSYTSHYLISDVGIDLLISLEIVFWKHIEQQTSTKCETDRHRSYSHFSREGGSLVY